MMLCIPGPWENPRDLVEAVAKHGNLEFLYGGELLVHVPAKTSIPMEFEGPFEHMREAFEIGGQGTISDETLDRLGAHKGVAYLHFEDDAVAERSRLIAFSEAIRRCGGIAVKVETSGVAHEWDSWFELLNSESGFDHYRAVVALIGDDDHYYSCGMHQFGLPDSQVPADWDAAEAAMAMHRFNYYQIAERPTLGSGHTISLSADADPLVMELVDDTRHEADDLFHNPHGVWSLTDQRP